MSETARCKISVKPAQKKYLMPVFTNCHSKITLIDSNYLLRLWQHDLQHEIIGTAFIPLSFLPNILVTSSGVVIMPYEKKLLLVNTMNIV